MDMYDSSMSARFAALLDVREARLRATLQAAGPLVQDASEGDTHEVTDFKDVASGLTQDLVDDIKLDHAAHELEQVLAAQRRVKDNSYGNCLACGDRIDLRRLLALPWAPFCAACQASREHSDQPPVRR